MIKLTPEETNDLEKIIIPTLSSAHPGTIFYFRDFFAPLSRSGSPRLSRYIYEALQQSAPPLFGLVRLNGTRMRDGVIKL